MPADLNQMSAAHNPLYIEFVSSLRHARIQHRLSQRELGKLLNKPQSFISKVETCERRLDLIETAAWCIALQLRLEAVLPRAVRESLAEARKRGK